MIVRCAPYSPTKMPSTISTCSHSKCAGVEVVQLADVRSQVTRSLISESENFAVFKPGDYQLPALQATLDQIVEWANALAPLRAARAVA
jgi:hypothetical protein